MEKNKAFKISLVVTTLGMSVILVPLLLIYFSGPAVPPADTKELVASQQAQLLQESLKKGVQLRIDDGEKKTEWVGEVTEPVSVLEVLKQMTKDKGIEIGIKQFSFGEMVESIDGKANNSNRVWIYLVNGQVANVGAGEKLVERGDEVEWQYQDVNK